ncbi:hypothetical protein PMALA_077410, partial [Plasmodium malariae]
NKSEKRETGREAERDTVKLVVNCKNSSNSNVNSYYYSYSDCMGNFYKSISSWHNAANCIKL